VLGVGLVEGRGARRKVEKRRTEMDGKEEKDGGVEVPGAGKGESTFDVRWGRRSRRKYR
jgi:hypothetical protein